MKRFIGLVLVLCVVAPVAFGSDEYTWTGGNADWTAGPWTLKVDASYFNNLGWTAPAAPYETQVYGTGTVKSRPQITDGSAIAVTTDLAPMDVGFAQMQITKGTVTVDNGGELRIADGYLQCTGNSQLSGLIVQNGGKYINAATGTGNQAGTLINYSTTGGNGFVTVSGAGSLFETVYLYSSRYTQTQVNYGTFNVLGSGSLINTQVVGPGGNNKVMTYNFTADAGGVSAINVGTSLAFKKGVGATYVANTATLNLFLDAAPTVGQSLVLFDLAEGAVRTGSLQDKWGYMLTEGEHISAYWGEDKTFWKITYFGGDTGNDIVLTAVPEPATLGLLSLGGLFLARRRRA